MKITYAQLIEISNGLNVLGNPYKDGDKTKNWEFAAKTRIKIARNIRYVNEASRDLESLQKNLQSELGDKPGEDASDHEHETYRKALRKFNNELSSLMKQDTEVNLVVINESELDLDKNNIQAIALGLLGDVLAYDE